MDIGWKTPLVGGNEALDKFQSLEFIGNHFSNDWNFFAV